ncbi:hypothetical protein Tco_0471334 [Tanacetum coccineum]
MHTDKDLEEPAHQEFDIGATEEQSDEETSQPPDCQAKPLAQWEDLRKSINELMDTPLDFSAFVMNWLKVDNLTLELLVGLTFKLMKGSCKSLVELEYLFEEVYKATTDQLDWNNHEGQQYLHDLQKPLPLYLILGRRILTLITSINIDLAYLSGGVAAENKQLYYKDQFWQIRAHQMD